MHNRPPGRFRSTLRRALSFGRGAGHAFFALLFPWKCPGCNNLLSYPAVLCEECAGLLRRIEGNICQRCGHPFPQHWRVKVCPGCRRKRSPIRKIRSFFYYEGLVQQMIRDAKYRRRARILYYFAEQFCARTRTEFPPTVEALVPVPLHRSREWDRTFNQALLIAEELSRRWEIPLWHPLLKTRRTLPQSSLSGAARHVNLKNAYRYVAKGTVRTSVLLIDDVITTGATLRECASVLRRAGVSRVYALTIARSVKAQDL